MMRTRTAKRLFAKAIVTSCACAWLVAGAAGASPYGWTLSEADDDPYDNTGASALLTKTVYLWLSCDSATEGVQSAEFGVLCSPQNITSFTPEPGFTDSGTDPSQPRITASGCPTGQVLVGTFVVDTGLFSANFSMCIVFSSNGKNETITCDGNVYSNDVVGFSTPASATPCGTPAAMCLNTDVAVAVNVDDPAPIELAPYHYTIMATNLGPLAATGVQVVDSLLAPFVYETHVASSGTVYNPATGIWTVGDLAVLETDSLTITVHADAGSAGSVYVNRARRVASSPFDPGSGRANDVDSVSVDVMPRPQANLGIDHSVLPAAVCEGDSTWFTLIVSNAGPDPATNVQALDVLRPGVTYAGSEPAGVYDAGSGIWSVGSLAVFEAETLTVTVTVDAGTQGTSLWNLGAVSTLDQADGFAANDADSVAIAVRPTGSSGIFEDATVVPDSAATIALDFGDDSEITDVLLFYRNGGEPTFSSMAMDSLPASDTWEAIVPGNEVGSSGMQIYAEVTSTCTSARVPATGFVNVSARIDDPATFVLPPAQYALLGVPFRADDVTPTGLFDELAPYDTQRWRYGTWNGANYGDGPGLARNAVAGQGFWIYAEAGATIAATGWTTSLAQDFVLMLQPEWNQIANPFGFPIAFTQLGRPNGINDDLVGYDGTGYLHFAETLEPGRGYWLRNSTGSALALTFPTSPPPASARAAPIAVAQDEGWAIGMSVAAGSAKDVGNLLGMRVDAVDGMDVHDYFDAPAPPGGFLLASFRDPEGRALQTDFRAFREPGASWDLVLISTLPATPFRMDVSVPNALPDGWEAVLLDPTGLGRYALTDGAAIAGLTLLAPETQTWHVIVGTPDYVTDRAHQVQTVAGPRNTGPDLTIAPNPMSEGQTVFTLTIPSPGRARVTIYDVAGRLVREVHDGPLTGGMSRFVWNASGGSGRRTPGGVYFVRLDTPSARVTRKIVVR